jgi:ribonuclease T2
MLKHHKGQYLLKVDYATPPQRWVDDNCLTLRPLRHSPLYKAGNQPVSTPQEVNVEVSIKDEVNNTNKYNNIDSKEYVNENISKQNLLALSWHNAFCETHRYKKECKRTFGSLLRSKPHETQFVLHGLWPQPRNNVYCNVEDRLASLDKNKRWRELPDLRLNDETEDELAKVMPGFSSGLHKHEWIKHGTCYGTDANAYYADAVSLVKQVNDSEVGRLFETNIGKTVSLAQVKDAFNRAFGLGAGNHVQLQCKGGMITELWLNLGSGSDDLATLLKKGERAFSRCERGRVDRAGF